MCCSCSHSSTLPFIRSNLDSKSAGLKRTHWLMNSTMSSLLIPILSPKVNNVRWVSESHFWKGLLNFAGNVAIASITDIASIVTMTVFILSPDSKIRSHTFFRVEAAS